MTELYCREEVAQNYIKALPLYEFFFSVCDKICFKFLLCTQTLSVSAQAIY